MIRIIISSVKYCNKAALREASQKTKESKRHVAYRVFIMLGLIINSACAAIVFIFTQTQRDLNGNIIFQVPETIFQDQYNDQKYFQVSQGLSLTVFACLFVSILPQKLLQALLACSFLCCSKNCFRLCLLLRFYTAPKTASQ